MPTRVPAPDGKKTADGDPLYVLPEGTVLNFTYEVSYLAAGGMGVVYKGRKGSETYCIKEVESNQLSRVLALSQEKATLERLDHPGIVKIIDCFDEDGCLYIVLEFIEGKSLEEFIHRGSGDYLAETLIEKWASQLYDIFEYLHSQNPPIIYRDLKPQNIMCRSDGRLCLVDFGIARVHKETKTADTYSVGTALTASPEHYGGKQTDGRSDIFTIGATLSYLATNGKGAGKGFFEFIPVRSINPDLSEKLGQVIDKAVRVLPEDRYQSVAEMREAHLGKAQSSEAPPQPSDQNVAGSFDTKKPKSYATLPLSPAIAAVVTIGIVLLSVFIIFMSGNELNTGKKNGATPLQLPSVTPSPDSPGTQVSFRGCTVIMPPGYSLNDKNGDENKIEYQKNDKERCRRLQVQVFTINHTPESEEEIEKTFRTLCRGYINKHFHNEVISVSPGKISRTPDGVRLNHYQFMALSTSDENQDKKIYDTHDISFVLHGENAFLLAAHADSSEFSSCSGEFNPFFDSLSFKPGQN